MTICYSPFGLDHGVGHPQWLLYEAKEHNYLKNKVFEDSGRYSEWPQVADAVIEAQHCRGGSMCLPALRYANVSSNVLASCRPAVSKPSVNQP